MSNSTVAIYLYHTPFIQSDSFSNHSCIKMLSMEFFLFLYGSWLFGSWSPPWPKALLTHSFTASSRNSKYHLFHATEIFRNVFIKMFNVCKTIIGGFLSVCTSLTFIASYFLIQMSYFIFSLFPVVYVVVSEIFPMAIRGRAVCVVSAVNWATNLLISMTFLTITGVCLILLQCIQPWLQQRGRILLRMSRNYGKNSVVDQHTVFYTKVKVCMLECI